MENLIEIVINRAMRDGSFSKGFDEWLRANWSIYLEFEAQAHKVIKAGRKHYGAKTIIEYMRHQTMLADATSEFKINNNVAPDLARLFALRNPVFKDLFEFRATKRARHVQAVQS